PGDLLDRVAFELEEDHSLALRRTQRLKRPSGARGPRHLSRPRPSVLSHRVLIRRKLFERQEPLPEAPAPTRPMGVEQRRVEPRRELRRLAQRVELLESPDHRVLIQVVPIRHGAAEPPGGDESLIVDRLEKRGQPRPPCLGFQVFHRTSSKEWTQAKRPKVAGDFRVSPAVHPDRSGTHTTGKPAVALSEPFTWA